MKLKKLIREEKTYEKIVNFTIEDFILKFPSIAATGRRNSIHSWIELSTYIKQYLILKFKLNKIIDISSLRQHFEDNKIHKIVPRQLFLAVEFFIFTISLYYKKEK